MQAELTFRKCENLRSKATFFGLFATKSSTSLIVLLHLRQKKMRRILGGKGIFPYRLTFYRIRTFCSDKPTIKNNSSSENGGSSSLSKYDEQYKALSNLDFMSAARILFSDPPKKKKFGLDFHVVQFFIACLPSLAVYLVAQYARSEMRKMDAELELKKQAEFEAQAKEMELKAAKEKAEAAANPEFLEVKERLNKLEETVKQIAEVTNKKSGDINELIQATQAAEGDKIEHRSEVDRTSKDRTNENKSGTAAGIHASPGNQKCTKNAGGV